MHTVLFWILSGSFLHCSLVHTIKSTKFWIVFFMKVQKFHLILNLDLTFSLYVKSKLEIKANFVTFLENLKSFKTCTWSFYLRIVFNQKAKLLPLLNMDSFIGLMAYTNLYTKLPPKLQSKKVCTQAALQCCAPLSQFYSQSRIGVGFSSSNSTLVLAQIGQAKRQLSHNHSLGWPTSGFSLLKVS